jgi:undecaprenyl diphosphate synthase
LDVTGFSAPNHLAIIMDGNRRWAYQKNKSTQAGHDSGSRIIQGVAERAYDRGVKWLTLFAFSSENWKRSSLELKGIMAVLQHHLENEFHILADNNIRLRIIGDLEGFSEGIKVQLKDSVRKTEGNTGLNLTIALGYGGQADLASAARRITEAVQAGMLKPDEIDVDAVKKYLMTADLPAIDLLLRTGGEIRVSNFLLWDLAYSELFFSDVLWPDFTPELLDDIFTQFEGRHRKFGGDEDAENFVIRAKSANS